MAEYYCKQLPNNLLQTYNVMRTRYLKNNDLIKSIQINISDLVNEILREVELVMNDQKEIYSNEYKKEILERLVNIQKLVFEKENDYGYNSVSILFNIIGLIKLEIKTKNGFRLVQTQRGRNKISCCRETGIALQPVHHTTHHPILQQARQSPRNAHGAFLNPCWNIHTHIHIHKTAIKVHNPSAHYPTDGIAQLLVPGHI
jgi:hypothetical protein